MKRETPSSLDVDDEPKSGGNQAGSTKDVIHNIAATNMTKPPLNEET